MSFWLSKASAEGSVLMPPAATQIAHEVSSLYMFLLVSSLIGFCVLIGGMLYFIVKYRRHAGAEKSAYITHDARLEFAWSFIPLCLFLFVFAWGWIIYHKMRTPPENAMEVYVQGRQWAWEFQYKSGRRSPDLYIPIGVPVKLIITSQDVLHSFYVPAFRVKQDAVPGRYTALWFNVEKPGSYHVFCAEYCGAVHSGMLAKVNALPLADYEKWMESDPEAANKGLTMAQIGEKVFNSKGCTACHSIDGTVKIGPALNGVYGHETTLSDGSKIQADEEYIRESILNPAAKVVQNFPAGVMPVFAGQLQDSELNALVEYIKSLK